MDINSEKYYSLLTGKIIKENDFGIQKIARIESLETFTYSVEIMNKIIDALKSNKPLPKDLPDGDVKNAIREYLDVFSVQDSVGGEFYVLVYDSDELAQDPMIVKIIKNR